MHHLIPLLAQELEARYIQRYPLVLKEFEKQLTCEETQRLAALRESIEALEDLIRILEREEHTK